VKNLMTLCYLETGTFIGNIKLGSTSSLHMICAVIILPQSSLSQNHTNAYFKLRSDLFALKNDIPGHSNAYQSKRMLTASSTLLTYREKAMKALHNEINIPDIQYYSNWQGAV
jgi:hypothetical protein